MPWDEFCDVKINNSQTTAADFICGEYNIKEMNDRITYLESLTPLPDLTLYDVIDWSNIMSISYSLPIDYQHPIVNIQIISPSNNIVMNYNSEAFRQSLKTTPYGDLWSENGTYTVNVNYSNGKTISSDFNYISNKSIIDHNEFKIFNVKESYAKNERINAYFYINTTISGVAAPYMILSDTGSQFLFDNNGLISWGDYFKLNNPARVHSLPFGNYTLVVVYENYYDEQIFEVINTQ